MTPCIVRLVASDDRATAVIGEEYGAVRRHCRVCGSDEHGKPEFVDPAAGHLSVAHAGGVTAVAVAPVPVGVDLEIGGSARPIARVACSPAELEALAELDASQREELALRIWVAKEAVLKLSGHGLSVDPASFSLVAHGQLLLARSSGEPEIDGAVAQLMDLPGGRILGVATWEIPAEVTIRDSESGAS